MNRSFAKLIFWIGGKAFEFFSSIQKIALTKLQFTPFVVTTHNPFGINPTDWFDETPIHYTRNDTSLILIFLFIFRSNFYKSTSFGSGHFAFFSSHYFPNIFVEGGIWGGIFVTEIKIRSAFLRI